MNRMDDPETLHRRARLRELTTVTFDGQSSLLDHIQQRTGKKPNQGEMSYLHKDNSGRSFGDKKARALCEQIGLPRMWFSMPLGTCLGMSDWDKPEFQGPTPTTAPIDNPQPSHNVISTGHHAREDHAPYHHDRSTAKAFQILGRKLAGLDGATKRQAGFILSELVEDPGNHAHLAELLDVALSNNRAGKQHAA